MKRFLVVFLVFGALILLVLYYLNSIGKLDLIKSRFGIGITPIDWKVNVCKEDGYKVSYPGNMDAHNAFAGENSCPRYYGYSDQLIDEAITLYPTSQQFSNNKEYIIKSKKDLVINGVNARYLEVNHIDLNENESWLVYEYSGNGKYYDLRLNLDYTDPMSESSFSKDTQWGQMVNEYNKTQNGGKNVSNPLAELTTIFHKMAQTFTLTTPVIQPVSKLETCLKTAQKNYDDNENRIRKPTGRPNEFTLDPKESTQIDLQYRQEANSCYRTDYLDKGSNKCLEQYPNDTNKEYDCYIENLPPVML
jgi:hypothetical protein